MKKYNLPTAIASVYAIISIIGFMNDDKWGAWA